MSTRIVQLKNYSLFESLRSNLFVFFTIRISYLGVCLVHLGSHETPAQVESKSGNSSFEDGQEQDDEMLIILHDMLSKLESPKV